MQSLGGQFYARHLPLLKQYYPQGRFDVHSGGISSQDLLLPGLLLNLEEEGNRLRIEFRLSGEYSTRSELYDRLIAQSGGIEKKVGLNVDWGGQMKRLKLEIDGLTGKPKSAWTDTDALEVIPLLSKLDHVVVPQVKVFLAAEG